VNKLTGDAEAGAGLLRAPLGAVVKNEWMKLWARKRFVLLGGLLLIVGLGSLFAANTAASLRQYGRIERQVLAQNIAQVKQQMHGAPPKERAALAVNLQQMEQQLQQLQTGSVDVKQALASDVQTLKGLHGSQRYSVQIQAATYRYDLDHHITSVAANPDSGWQLPGIVLGGSSILALAFLVLFVVVDNVASERQGGTVPLMFLHAGNRLTLFFGKTVVAVVATWAIVIIAALGFFVLGGLLMGFGSATTPQVVGVSYAGSGLHLALASGRATILSQAAYDLWGMVLALLSLGAWAVLMVGLSTFLASTGFAMGIGGAILLAGQFLPNLHSPALLADPTVHLSLMSVWVGKLASRMELSSATVLVSAGVLAAWTLLALTLGSWRFSRLEP
jgi:ABC-type transport system involved in multi-copper enzyme maturation permease subunit